MNIKKASGKGKKWMVTEVGRCVLSTWGFECAIAQKRVLEWRWGSPRGLWAVLLLEYQGRQQETHSFSSLCLLLSSFSAPSCCGLSSQSPSSCSTQPGKFPTPAYHLHPPPLPQVVLAHCHPCCSWPGSVASSEVQSTHFVGH